MFTLGKDELDLNPELRDVTVCDKCEKKHSIHQIDGLPMPHYYECGDKSFLCLEFKDSFDFFKRFTRYTRISFLRQKVTIRCKKGLWSVEGNDPRVISEAFNYFWLYEQDGEYP